jgi:hypothetical protein
MSRARLANLAPLTVVLADCSTLSGYPRNYQNTTAVLEADAPYLSADVRINATVPNSKARGEDSHSTTFQPGKAQLS